MMLKCIFDTTAQLARHLRVSGDSTLMFVRDEHVGLHAGIVLLEFQLRDAAVAAIVRGEVIGRSTGEVAGFWVQLDSRLARHLARQGKLTSRREARISASHAMLRLRGKSELAVQLLDVSPGGLRVRGGLTVTDAYTVCPMGARRCESDIGIAEVVRVDAAESGLRFLQPRSRTLLGFIARLGQDWAVAHEVHHPFVCPCARGAPAEPLAPLRQKDS
jgi:hypothetical protein